MRLRGGSALPTVSLLWQLMSHLLIEGFEEEIVISSWLIKGNKKLSADMIDGWIEFKTLAKIKSKRWLLQ